MNFWTKKKVLLTGASGFLGQYIARELDKKPCTYRSLRGRKDLDLTDSYQTEDFFKDFRPHVVIHAAARVGGIGANMEAPGDFFIENSMMGTSILNACRYHKPDVIVFINTTCAYPATSPIPFREENIWGGYPEPTNAPYGVAKRALGVGLRALGEQYNIKTAEVIPTNLYGPGDHFEEEKSHVIPALMKKLHEHGSPIKVWGDGTPTRDFLHVADAARGVVMIAEKGDGLPYNLGSGQEVSISALICALWETGGFKGALRVLWDHSKPNGQMRRALDISRARGIGWKPEIGLAKGLRELWQWYRHPPSS